MNGNSNQTNTHYVVVLVDQARRLGLDVDKILSETGIRPELADTENQWIENSYLTALVKTMWRETNNETMGFDPAPLPVCVAGQEVISVIPSARLVSAVWQRS